VLSLVNCRSCSLQLDLNDKKIFSLVINYDIYALMHIPSDALACGETRPDG